jgi:predicted membrane chloride channel (bestrophin family)
LQVNLCAEIVKIRNFLVAENRRLQRRDQRQTLNECINTDPFTVLREGITTVKAIVLRVGHCLKGKRREEE